MKRDYSYPGQELELFEEARAWKQYLASHLTPFISGSVLEVGAGIGETTPYLLNKNVLAWTAMEPDPRLYAQIEKKKQLGKLPGFVHPFLGELADIPEETEFDTIIYIDVLEHIENDGEELRRAAAHLRKQGKLIVLSPAYPSLYSPFDQAVGHYRRYTQKTLRRAVDPHLLREKKIFFLESAGLSLLFLNRYIVKNRYPGRVGIWIWQHIFIPLSTVLDRMLRFRIGKSIIGIWEKL